MKNSTKKLIQSILIFIVTVIIGFGITLISFNLFDTLTANQMRILFAADVIILLFIGTIAWFVYESQKSVGRKNCKSKEKISNKTNKMNNSFDFSNFAA